MKKVLRFLGYTLIALLVLAAIGITFTIGWRPFIGPKARPLTARKFEATPERLKRGEYIATHVAGCMECHTPGDWMQHEVKLDEARMGAGQPMPLNGLPGRIIASNLTPDPETGTGNWSDDQLARAIREGIGHDGRALFPMMPYSRFRHMTDEDLASVIVFLRSLLPVRNALPRTEVIFPVNYLIRSEPQPLTEPVQAVVSTPVKRGQYLVAIANCGDCHTPMKQGKFIPEMDLAGGRLLEGPFGHVASANITPDPTGISYYTEDLFVQAMRTGYVGGVRKLNQIMPWSVFRGMTDEDLKAMFAYLKTVKPVVHRVDNSETPTQCKRCGAVHGLGDKN